MGLAPPPVGDGGSRESRPSDRVAYRRAVAGANGAAAAAPAVSLFYEMHSMSRALVIALRAASIIAFLLLWEWAARVPISFNFPSPVATLAALIALLRSG